MTAEKDAENLRKIVLQPLLAKEREVILVMHSHGGMYGGSTIGENTSMAARQKDGLKGGIQGFIYMVALMIPPGLTTLSYSGVDDFSQLSAI